MEFKYAKNSQTLEELLVANEQKEKQQREESIKLREQLKREEEERMEQSGLYFHSGQEVIEYILSGRKIVDYGMFPEWMQFNGKEYIARHHMDYSEFDCPCGYTNTYLTIDEFCEWVRACEKLQIQNKEKFVNKYWHKEINEQ